MLDHERHPLAPRLLPPSLAKSETLSDLLGASTALPTSASNGLGPHVAPASAAAEALAAVEGKSPATHAGRASVVRDFRTTAAHATRDTGASFTLGKINTMLDLPQPATLDDARREMEALLGEKGRQIGDSTSDTPAAVRRALDALVGGVKSATIADLPAGEMPHGAVFAEPDTAARARTRYLRRQLAAAVDHAAALLPLLARPRLVDAGFAPIDLAAAGEALDGAIGALDALDAPGEDLEDDEREIPEDDELSLGWREAVSQVDLGQARDDGEPTLGAPERSPWVCSLGHPHYEAANGRRPGRGFGGRHYSQVAWAAGSHQDGEGEAEPGYDLPCDEDELDDDGLSRGEGPDTDAEWTALESHGAGFRSSGPDDTEDDGERAIVVRRPRAWEPSAGHLAARAKQQKRGVAFGGDGLARPWLLGADRVFGMGVEGDCCAPHILDGSVIHVDREAKPQAGDFVALWFEATRDGRPVMVGWVKRLASDLFPGMRLPHVMRGADNVVPMLDVEQLNPPRGFMIDARRVHAVFKVVGVIPPAEAIAARQAKRAAARGGR